MIDLCKNRFRKLPFKSGIALIFFAIVFVSLPYEFIRGGAPFADLGNYIAKFSVSSNLNKHAGDTLRGWVSNELLWEHTVRNLMQWLALDSRDTLRLIAFVSVLSCAAYVKKGSGWIWLLLLFNPFFVDLIMSQCRSAFAISLFYLSLVTNRKLVAVTVGVASVFIHTSMLPIILFYWIGWGIFKVALIRSKPLIGVLFLIFMGVGVALLMGPLEFLIGGVIDGDRRVGRYIGGGTPFYYSVAWLCLLPVFAFVKPKLNTIPNNAFATTMLSVFGMCFILDLYGTRFVAAAFPSIICSVYRLPIPMKNYTLTGLILFTLVQIIFWG